MTYATGQQIQATDYNTMSNNLASVWGQGTGNKGWGQDSSSFANVAVSNTVTATQWSNLIGKTNSALAHIGLSQITPSSVTAGSPISYYSSITTGISNVTGAASGQTTVSRTDSAATVGTYSGTWGDTGNRGLVFTHTITFASGDQARYFFNSGGRLALSFARTGGSATTRNTEWSTLCTRCGQWRYSALSMAQAGGSGTPTIPASTGYWNTGTSAAQQITMYDGYAAYSTNYITTYATLGGTAQNGGRPVITLQSYWINVWSNTFQQTVDGVATTSLVLQTPATTYIANTWGTPSVSASAALY
jgi:hypothetical protein